MLDLSLGFDLLVAGLIGLAVGLEREWSGHATGPDARFAGVRTFTLLGAIGGIAGWPVPEARAFLRDLMEHATQPQFVYAHKWNVGDLVMWDNHTVMHRATRFDDLKEVRDLRRTSLKGVRPEVRQQPSVIASAA